MEEHIIEIKGARFETLINRARKIDKRIRRPSKQELKNLINTENGKGLKYLGNSAKQIEDLKKRLENTFTLLLKLELNDTERVNIENCLNSIQNIESSNDVIELVDIGIENTPVM